MTNKSCDFWYVEKPQFNCKLRFWKKTSLDIMSMVPFDEIIEIIEGARDSLVIGENE
ncbi:hypothetical protein P4U65_33300 [Bacillus pacificus]|nr:hypothetical protein [Bacillus thuringiensis]MED1305270.1 hypothetical protein [Bacillus pacificus]